jgi:hypothetical protein
MDDSQNAPILNEQPLPAEADDASCEEPLQKSYYYDDATGYTIYDENNNEEAEE